jgi:hypothetical protein
MKSNIKSVYLGTWFPRTSLHLRELFDYFHSGIGVSGLDVKLLSDYHTRLGLEKVQICKETDFDYIKAEHNNIVMTITEDGIILLQLDNNDPEIAVEILTKFYEQQLSPAISYLFSRGAPLPRELLSVSDILPFVAVGHDLTTENNISLLSDFGETMDSRVSNKDVEIFFGKTIEIVNILSNKKNGGIIDIEFLRFLIFFREFEYQLSTYLHLHRELWEKISEIREKRTIRYRDFPRVREEMLDYLETMSFVKARLAQMRDILQERQDSTNVNIMGVLEELSLDRFAYLSAEQEYIVHLWQMTTEYVHGTLSLLESLFNEHTQREITTLKYVTLVGVLTSFFGMNIAFPWEERWPSVFQSSFEVVGLITLLAFGFYYFLKFFIYNRRFVIRRK